MMTASVSGNGFQAAASMSQQGPPVGGNTARSRPARLPDVPRGSGDDAAPPSPSGRAGAAVAPRRTATFRMDRRQAGQLVTALKGAIFMDAVSREIAEYLADVVGAHLSRHTDELCVRIATAYEYEGAARG